MLASLLENIGRFLLESPKTQPVMHAFMSRYSSLKRGLDTRGCMILDNAYFSVYPGQGLMRTEMDPHELYARYLIENVNVSNAQNTLAQLLKFDWKDVEVRQMLRDRIEGVWRVCGGVDCVAWIVAELWVYYPEFGVDLVDGVVESVRRGVEMNRGGERERRIATAKFLGELYNYYVVGAGVVFDTLWLLLRYGHEGGVARPGVASVLDGPNDTFRISLVCALLETCGENLGLEARKGVDVFMRGWIMYVWTKRVVGIELEERVRAVVELVIPGMKVAGSYSEAVRECNLVARTNGQEANGAKEKTAEKTQVDVADSEVEEVSDSDASDELQEDAVQEDTDAHQAEAAFDLEYAKLLQDSLDARKFERKIAVDIPVPLRQSGNPTNITNNQTTHTNLTELAQVQPEKMTFTLLTKRNQKQVTHELELPQTARFVAKRREDARLEGVERGRVKESVLAYEKGGYGETESASAGMRVLGDAKDADGKERMKPRRLGDTNALFQPRNYYT